MPGKLDTRYLLVIPKDLLILTLLEKKNGAILRDIIEEVYGVEEPRSISKAYLDIQRLMRQGLILKDYRKMPDRRGYIKPHSYFTLSEEGARLLRSLKKILKEVGGSEE